MGCMHPVAVEGYPFICNPTVGHATAPSSPTRKPKGGCSRGRDMQLRTRATLAVASLVSDMQLAPLFQRPLTNPTTPLQKMPVASQLLITNVCNWVCRHAIQNNITTQHIWVFYQLSTFFGICIISKQHKGKPNKTSKHFQIFIWSIRKHINGENRIGKTCTSIIERYTSVLQN